MQLFKQNNCKRRLNYIFILYIGNRNSASIVSVQVSENLPKLRKPVSVLN